MRLNYLAFALSGASRLLNAQVVLPARSVEGGTTVLTHRADALGRAPGWKLGALIGRAGGAGAPNLELTNVLNVALMSDGRMLTLSPVGNLFYRFSATGKFEQALARRGAGPGEIMAPGGLGAAGGDTVFIVDGSNNRISWFTAQSFVRGMPIPSSALSSMAIGALRSGDLVVRDFAGYPDSRAKFPTRVSVHAYLIPKAGATARKIADVEDVQFEAMETNYRGKRRVTPDIVRFTPMAHMAVWDTVIVTASSHAFLWDIRNRDGRVVRRLRLAQSRRQVTEPIRAAKVAEVLDQMQGPGSEAMIDKAESIRLAKIAPTADSLPAFDALLVSRDQLLWVVDAQAPTDHSGAATAFRADGAIVGRLSWSGKRMPFAFGADRVVMRETDADGVVSLAIYKLVK